MAKLVIVITIFLVIFATLYSPPVIAKADDLVIDDNGSVSLVVTSTEVLAITTSAGSAPATSSPATSAPAKTNAPSAPTSQPKADQPVAGTPAPAPAKTSAPAPTVAPKIVPVAPANSNTTVKISPNTTSDKKLNITIETTAKTPAPVATIAPTTSKTSLPAAIPATSVPVTPTPAPANVQTSEKTVDNVILRDANKAPVITIQADKGADNTVTINQQNVNVSTNLPIQIDSKTHVVSVDTSKGTEAVSVLPDQAVKGASEKVSDSSLQTVSSNVSLQQNNGQAEYVVNQTKKGKLLGFIDVTIPSEVKISAQTGKTISVWQSPLSFLSGILIK